MISPLLAALLLALTLPIPREAGACEAVDPEAVGAEARRLLLKRRYDEVDDLAERWRMDVTCVADRATPEQLARPFRYAGVAAYEKGDGDRAGQWFMLALMVDDDLAHFDLETATRLRSAASSLHYDTRQAMGTMPYARLRICEDAVVDGVRVASGTERTVYGADQHLIWVGGEARWVPLSPNELLPVGDCPDAPQLATASAEALSHAARLVTAARGWVSAASRAREAGAPPPELRRDDCSGFVEQVMAEAGMPNWRGQVVTMHDRAVELRLFFRHERSPSPGDLVFFSNTHDVSRDGITTNDPWTHIGIVEEVGPEGQLGLIHKGSRSGISRIRMNLRWPDDTARNSVLVVNRPDAPQGKTPMRTTGATWSGFASPWMEGN